MLILRQKLMALLIVASFLIALLLTGCGGTNDTSTVDILPVTGYSPIASTKLATAPTPGQAGATTATGAGTGTGAAEVNPASGEAVQALPTGGTPFNYASLQFKITSGTISLPTANTISNANMAQLKLDLTVTNPTKDTIQLDAGLFQIKLSDGTLLKQPINLSVAARDTQPLTLLFSVAPATKWNGLQLQFDEKDKEPVLVALDGATKSSPYPVSLAAPSELQVKDPKVSYKVTKASLDLDAQGTRVGKGQQFLVMSILVSNLDKQYDAYVGDENFRLILDNGKPEAPTKTDPVAEGVPALGQTEFEIAFAIPQATAAATLEVGEAGKSSAKTKLVLVAGAAGVTTPASATLPVATTKPAPKSAPSNTPTSIPSTDATPVEVAGSTSALDPCQLFTQDDFMRVFGKAANAPDQDDLSDETKCSYEFSDLYQTSNLAYGLDITVLNGDFDRKKFEDTYQALQMQPGFQPMAGVGDEAYFLPAATSDMENGLFVLKGKVSFSLSLLEPSSVSAAQLQTALKAAAQVIMARL